MGPARTCAISQNLTAYLVKQPHIGLDVVAVESDAFILDEYTRLAIRRRSQSRPQARYRRVQVVTGAIKLGMGPQLHCQRLAVDERIHAQCKPLGKRRRLLAAPHFVRNGKPVALGAKRTKHANLDMVDGINGFNLAGLEQALALPFQIVAQRVPRQLAHGKLLAYPGRRLAQTMHGKARKEPIRWL